MPPNVTPAHREILAHLLEEDSFTLGVIPATLAGHYHPAEAHKSGLTFDWIDPIPVFAHPADPARLLIGVYTDRGWTLVALDHLAHSYCLHPICTAVTGRRVRELAQIPADGGLFAALDVDTSFDTIPLTYVVHVADYQAAQEQGWTGRLHDHTELRWNTLNPSWPADLPEDDPTCPA